MIEVVTNTGEKFLAETYEQLVGLMWKAAFIEEAGPGEYMEAVAKRVKTQTGRTIRIDSAGAFIIGLHSARIATYNIIPSQGGHA